MISRGYDRCSEGYKLHIPLLLAPGNIRELQNVVEYLCFTGEKVIKREDLPVTFLRLAGQEKPAVRNRDLSVLRTRSFTSITVWT